MAAPLPLPLPLTFLLQFSGIYPHHTLLCNLKVDDTPMQNPEENKIIVGRDIIRDLEVDIKFSTAVPTRSWDNFIIPMIHKRGYWSREKLTYVFHTSNLESAVADLDRGSNILPNHWFCISIFSRCQAFKRRFKQWVSLPICTTLDMNISYWTITMCPESQRICIYLTIG